MQCVVCVAVCCSVLKKASAAPSMSCGRAHTATHCNTLQHTEIHCYTLQHTATHCNTLQHTATHCNTLQRSLPIVNLYAHFLRLDMHSLLRTYKHTHSRTYKHTHTRTYKHTHTRTYKHTHTRTYKHTHTHTYKYTNTNGFPTPPPHSLLPHSVTSPERTSSFSSLALSWNDGCCGSVTGGVVDVGNGVVGVEGDVVDM